MAIENAARLSPARSRTPSAIPITTANWQAYRAAYEEVVAGRPPDYDRRWSQICRSPDFAGPVAGMYEVMREACLTMKLAGTLPTWPRNRRLPVSISATYEAVKQERRLGRDANLVLTLTPPPAEVGAEFASVY